MILALWCVCVAAVSGAVGEVPLERIGTPPAQNRPKTSLDTIRSVILTTALSAGTPADGQAVQTFLHGGVSPGTKTALGGHNSGHQKVEPEIDETDDGKKQFSRRAPAHPEQKGGKSPQVAVGEAAAPQNATAAEKKTAEANEPQGQSALKGEKGKTGAATTDTLKSEGGATAGEETKRAAPTEGAQGTSGATVKEKENKGEASAEKSQGKGEKETKKTKRSLPTIQPKKSDATADVTAKIGDKKKQEDATNATSSDRKSNAKEVAPDGKAQEKLKPVKEPNGEVKSNDKAEQKPEKETNASVGKAQGKDSAKEPIKVSERTKASEPTKASNKQEKQKPLNGGAVQGQQAVVKQKARRRRRHAADGPQSTQGAAKQKQQETVPKPAEGAKVKSEKTEREKNEKKENKKEPGSPKTTETKGATKRAEVQKSQDKHSDKTSRKTREVTKSKDKVSEQKKTEETPQTKEKVENQQKDEKLATSQKKDTKEEQATEKKADSKIGEEKRVVKEHKDQKKAPEIKTDKSRKTRDVNQKKNEEQSGKSTKQGEKSAKHGKEKSAKQEGETKSASTVTLKSSEGTSREKQKQANTEGEAKATSDVQYKKPPGKTGKNQAAEPEQKPQSRRRRHISDRMAAETREVRGVVVSPEVLKSVGADVFKVHHHRRHRPLPHRKVAKARSPSQLGHLMRSRRAIRELKPHELPAVPSAKEGKQSRKAESVGGTLINIKHNPNVATTLLTLKDGSQVLVKTDHRDPRQAGAPTVVEKDKKAEGGGKPPREVEKVEKPKPAVDNIETLKPAEGSKANQANQTQQSHIIVKSGGQAKKYDVNTREESLLESLPKGVKVHGTATFVKALKVVDSRTVARKRRELLNLLERIKRDTNSKKQEAAPTTVDKIDGKLQFESAPQTQAGGAKQTEAEKSNKKENLSSGSRGAKKQAASGEGRAKRDKRSTSDAKSSTNTKQEEEGDTLAATSKMHDGNFQVKLRTEQLQSGDKEDDTHMKIYGTLEGEMVKVKGYIKGDLTGAASAYVVPTLLSKYGDFVQGQRNGEFFSDNGVSGGQRGEVGFYGNAAQRQQNGLNQQAQFADNQNQIQGQRKDNGFYDNQAGAKSGHDVGRNFNTGQTFDKKGERGSFEGKQGNHRKGYKNAGFRNTYHKDESANQSSFFDDLTDEGGHNAFDNSGASYTDKGADVNRGDFINAAFLNDGGGRSGGFDGGSTYKDVRGQAGNFANNHNFDDQAKYDYQRGGNNHGRADTANSKFFNGGAAFNQGGAHRVAQGAHPHHPPPCCSNAPIITSNGLYDPSLAVRNNNPYPYYPPPNPIPLSSPLDSSSLSSRNGVLDLRGGTFYQGNGYSNPAVGQYVPPGLPAPDPVVLGPAPISPIFAASPSQKQSSAVTPNVYHRFSKTSFRTGGAEDTGAGGQPLRGKGFATWETFGNSASGSGLSIAVIRQRADTP